MTRNESSTTHCDPKDVSLKSFFLGPQAENADWLRTVVLDVLGQWFKWRQSIHPEDGRAISNRDQSLPEFTERQERFKALLFQLLHRYESEVPKFSPRYIGHMFSEISLPALLGHIVTLLHNPNNISGESSLVGVGIEDEAIRDLAKMAGYDAEEARGHFTSGGTVANFEALVRARDRMSLWLAAAAASRLDENLFRASHLGWTEYDNLLGKNPGLRDKIPEWRWIAGNPMERAERLSKRFGQRFLGPVILVPENKHYSWKKGVSLLGLGDEAFWPVHLDDTGKLDVEHLRERLEEAEQARRPVMLVVSVAGTTELGEIDPINRVQDLLDDWRDEKGIHIWHHVDAAYGGFYRSLGTETAAWLGAPAAAALAAIARADSVTLDPHKLAYVPYSSGAFLVRQKRDYAVQTFDSPYIEFKSSMDRGPYTIEGSRSAAGATATWLTSRCIGFNEQGYGRILSRGVAIRRKLEETLLSSSLPIRINPSAETNILAFTLADLGEKTSSSNEKARAIYARFAPGTTAPFTVSKTALGWDAYGKYLDRLTSSWQARRDTNDLVLIRLCLMNPFFASKEMSADFFTEFVDLLAKELK